MLLVVLLPVAVFALVPRIVTRTAARLRPGCLYDTVDAGIRRDSLVALTIDDAPDRMTTPAILDALAANGAHATFFAITDQVPGAEPVLARARAEGHELGNHFTADRPAIGLDSAAFEADLRESHAMLESWGPMRWARPGSGWYSARMVRQMERAGYRCALGSVYPLDAQLPFAWTSERYLLAHVRPGSIVILHDRGPRGARTARVLGRVLPALRARGYRVVTLEELVGQSAGRTDNQVHR
jgi:peptidoglycan/xylan/chitin deacetylase (PgdA/CDA1 family)